MPDRPGDMPIEDRVNEGQCELRHFFPSDEGGRDAYQAIIGSPMRRAVYFNDTSRPTPHQSTSRESRGVGGIPLPEYVVSSRIELDGRTWNYSTTQDLTNPAAIRRVFIERDQALELDIEETLRWLSVSAPGTIQDEPRLEDMHGANEEEKERAHLRARADYMGRKRSYDIAQTRYTETLRQLQEETSLDNLNNQVILQGMYERIQRGESMLPYSAKVTRTDLEA